MFGLSTTGLLALLTQYGYEIIFPISILEGPLVAALAGFLISTGALQFVPVFLLLLLGDALGDTLYYFLGRASHQEKPSAWLQFIGITEERVHRFVHFFRQHDWKIILLGKTQAVGGAILFSAGYAHVPYWKYLKFNVLGSVPKILLFLAIGYHLGSAFEETENTLNAVGGASFVFALFLILSYFLFKRMLKKHYKELDHE